MDLSAFGLDGMDHEWIKVIDLSVPVMVLPNKLIVPWPKEESRLLASIRPFQPLVY